MFLGISKTLKKMGGFRLHLGLNMKKWYTWLILFFVAIFYVTYYIVLGILWAIYGLAWCVYQLGRLWIKLFRRLQKGWQKGLLVGGTAVLVLILVIVGAASGHKTPPSVEAVSETDAETVTYEDAYAMAEDLFDENTADVVTASDAFASESTATTRTPTTTTTKPTTTTTTTTTKPTTTTTTITTKPTTTTTTTTTKPTTTTTTKRETTTSIQNTSNTYVLNTNTHKFHHSWCSSVSDIEPQNYATADSRDYAISNGYQPCKRCNP